MKLDVERIFGLENAQIDMQIFGLENAQIDMQDLINQVYINKDVLEIIVGYCDDKVPCICINFCKD